MRRYLPLDLDVALLILRLALAAVLLYHGLPKVMNFGATVGAFQSMNVPAPTLTAAFAVLSEVIGGILILLGIAVDLAGLLVVIDMLGAIFTVHWPNGFDFTKGGWEHPFSVLIMALVLALAGPGRYSVGINGRVAGRSTAALSALLLLVSCSDDPGTGPLPLVGVVQISTTTTGQPSSGEGYAYILDDNPPDPIGFNATVEVNGVRVGSHTVQLTSLPQGCSVSSPNPVPVTVTDDVPGTAAFQVSCIPTTPSGTGNILLTAATSGPGPQNYALLLGPEEQGIIGSNGTQVLPDLAAGTYSVGISSVPANCQVQESNPQQVTVTAHQNINISFTVSCTSPSPQSGTILIEANTSGSTDPDGYLVSLDGGGAQPVGMQFGVVIENVPAGSHSILLEDLDGSCSLAGANPVDVTLSHGQVVTLTFEVNC